VAKVCRGW